MYTMDIMDVVDTTDSQEEEEEEEEEREEYKEEEKEEEEKEEEEEEQEEEEKEKQELEEEEDEDTEPEVRTRPRRRSHSLSRQQSGDVEKCASPPRQRRRTTSRLGHGAMDHEQGGQVEVDIEAYVQVNPEGSRPQARRKRARREGGAVHGWQGNASVESPGNSPQEEELNVSKIVGSDGGSGASEVLAETHAVDVTNDPLAGSLVCVCDENGGNGGDSGSAKMKGKGNQKGKVKAKGRRKRVPENMSDSYSDGSSGSDYSGYADTYAKTRPRSARIQTRRSSALFSPSLPPATLAEPLEIDNDDDDDDDDFDGTGSVNGNGNGGLKATGAQTSHSFSNTPQSGATVAMMLSSDDEGRASETQRESSFVSTYLGDGIMDIRDRSQRNGTIEGTHKVRLSWATAYLRPECIRTVPHETRLVYPNKDTTGAVRVTRSDLIRLQENVFVNDTIIDFYLRYLLSHDESFGQGLSRSSVHAFSPLVVQAITNAKDAPKPDAYWRKIQKWTKGLDLFTKKIVFFPINSALHWSLVVLFNPDLFKPQARVLPGNQDEKGPGIATSTGQNNTQGNGGVGGFDGDNGGVVNADTKVDEPPVVLPPRQDLKDSKNSKKSKKSNDSKNSKNSKDSRDPRRLPEEDGAAPLVLPAKAAGRTTDDANNSNAPRAAPSLPFTPRQELSPRDKLGLIWPPISEVGRHTEFVEEILASGGCVSGSPATSPSRRRRGADSVSDAANGIVAYCDISSNEEGACKGPMSPNCLVTLKNANPNSQNSPHSHVSPNGRLAFNGKITPKGRGSRTRSARAKADGDRGGKGGVDEGYGCSRAGEIIGGGRPTAAPTAAPTPAPTAPSSAAPTAAPTPAPTAPSSAAPKASPKATREDARTAGPCAAQPLDIESSAGSLQAAAASNPPSGTKSGPGASYASTSAAATPATAGASASLDTNTISGGNPRGRSCSSLPPTTPSSSTALGAVHGKGRRRGDEGGALPPAGGSCIRSKGRPDDVAAEKARDGDDAGPAEQGARKRGGKEKAGVGPEAAVTVSRCSLQGLSGGAGVGSVGSSVTVGGSGGAGPGGAGVGTAGAGAGADVGAGDGAASIGRGGDGGVSEKEGRVGSPSPRTPEVTDKDSPDEKWMHQNGDAASLGSALEGGDVGADEAASVSGGSSRDGEPADDSDDTDDLPGSRRLRQRTLRSGGHVPAVGETPVPLKSKLKAPVKLPTRTSVGGGGKGAGAAPRKPMQRQGREGAAGEERQQGNPVPCMLLLDSTKGHRSQDVFRMVRKYVEAAWNNTRGDELGRVCVDAKVLPGCSPPVPLQENDCDCGVYVVHYAKLLLENPPLLTKQFLANGCRGGMFKKNWFDKTAISDTRVSIRRTVERLRWQHVQQERDNSDAASSPSSSSAAATAAAGSDRK